MEAHAHSVCTFLGFIGRGHNLWDTRIKRFVTATFNKKPIMQSVPLDIWDPFTVLHYWSTRSTCRLSTATLAKKTVLLIALATTCRPQAIQDMITTAVECTQQGMLFHLRTPMKTFSMHNNDPALQRLLVPVIPGHKDICPAEYVLLYLQWTQKARKWNPQEKYVFLTQDLSQAVHHETISHWIKNALQEARVDMTKHKPYSACDTSALVKWTMGTSLDTLLKHVGWRTPQAFIQHYHKQMPCMDSSDPAMQQFFSHNDAEPLSKMHADRHFQQ